jgi:hypothetical protein
LILRAGWRREKGRDRDSCKYQAFHNAEIVPPQPEEAGKLFRGKDCPRARACCEAPGKDHISGS